MASRMVSQIFRSGGVVTIGSYVGANGAMGAPLYCTRRTYCTSRTPRTLVSHPVDDVVHAELIRAAGDIHRESFIGGPLPVLRDIAVVVREREHAIVGVVVDEERAIVGLHVDGRV